MENLIIWGIQATVDYRYIVEDDLTTIVGEWADEKTGILPQKKKLFDTIAGSGLTEDLKENLQDRLRKISNGKDKGKEANLKMGIVKNRKILSKEIEVKFIKNKKTGEEEKDTVTLPKNKFEVIEDIAEQLDEARKYLDEPARNYKWKAELGGNPAIAAVRGYQLKRGVSESKLPKSVYVGLYPDSVKDYVAKYLRKEEPDIEKKVFESKIRLKAQPQTVSLESDRKLMLVYGPGRSLLYMDEQMYFKMIKETLKKYKNDGVVFAFMGIYPESDASKLIGKIKDRYKKAKIFIGTGSFKKDEIIDKVLVTETYYKILEKADIVSFNDDELHDLHTVIVGKGARKPISLADKLKELELDAIKVCHSADGAILDLGVNPESVINNKQIREDPYGYLQEALQLSVDGASYVLDSVKIGRKANETAVRTYSESITKRSKELFNRTFLKTVEHLPGGLVTVYAPLVVHPLATLTGIGAIFDSLLLSFLMRN